MWESNWGIRRISMRGVGVGLKNHFSTDRKVKEVRRQVEQGMQRTGIIWATVFLVLLLNLLFHLDAFSHQSAIGVWNCMDALSFAEWCCGHCKWQANFPQRLLTGFWMWMLLGGDGRWQCSGIAGLLQKLISDSWRWWWLRVGAHWRKDS